jgi:hypothetical protein
VCVLQVVGHEKDLREVIIKISNYLKKDYNFFVINYNTCMARALLLVFFRLRLDFLWARDVPVSLEAFFSWAWDSFALLDAGWGE